MRLRLFSAPRRHLGQHETVVVAAEAQERHAFLVDVGNLEAEHARVEIDHFREVAAVEADVADLRMRMGLSGSVIRVAPGEGSRVPLERTRVLAGLTASIM